MPDLNDIDKEIIEQNIKTDAGFKQFVATRLWSIDEKIEVIAKRCPLHEGRLFEIEDKQRQITTGWKTFKWIFGIFWGVIVFVIGLFYKDIVK